MPDHSLKTILILGGTGHYGREVAAGLLAKKVRVRILSRNPKKAAELFLDAEIVSGDLEDRAALQTAMTGVDGIVYAISALSVGQVRRIKQIEE
ncbi:MAG: NAD-dependent epimerase/dehydratase family protein, partial [Desulfobacteraceae bacterium]